MFSESLRLHWLLREFGSCVFRKLETWPPIIVIVCIFHTAPRITCLKCRSSHITLLLLIDILFIKKNNSSQVTTFFLVQWHCLCNCHSEQNCFVYFFWISQKRPVLIESPLTPTALSQPVSLTLLLRKTLYVTLGCIWHPWIVILCWWANVASEQVHFPSTVSSTCFVQVTVTEQINKLFQAIEHYLKECYFWRQVIQKLVKFESQQLATPSSLGRLQSPRYRKNGSKHHV